MTSAVAKLAANECDVRLAVERALEGENLEVPEFGGQPRLGDLAHEPLGAHPVLDQIGDRHQQQAVAPGELASSGTRAIVPSSFMISQMTPAG